MVEQKPDESIEELQRQKLMHEVQNLKRSPWRNPAFTAPIVTLAIATLTYLYFWNSGIFDYKQAHINYVTDTLTTRAKHLDTLVRIQSDSSISLNKRLAKIDNDIKVLDSIKSSLYESLPVSKREIAKLVIENKNLTAKLNTCDSLSDFLRDNSMGSRQALYHMDLDLQSLKEENKNLALTVAGYKRNLIIIDSFYRPVYQSLEIIKKSDEQVNALWQKIHRTVMWISSCQDEKFVRNH